MVFLFNEERDAEGEEIIIEATKVFDIATLLGVLLNWEDK